ncbi:hypothetical protein [Kaistia adipata]|uniref:hypothetical protein n=1 Tax=Kaistia adipata TaxID=166954 RepID=UPI0012EC0B7C|nr:hypothetical protein [Kaistia adipata]
MNGRISLLAALVLWLVSGLAAVAQEKCRPVDWTGRACIQVRGGGPVLGFQEYTGFYVDNICARHYTMEVEKRDGSWVPGHAMPGTQQMVTHCKTSECGGYTGRISIVCPFEAEEAEELKKPTSPLVSDEVYAARHFNFDFDKILGPATTFTSSCSGTVGEKTRELRQGCARHEGDLRYLCNAKLTAEAKRWGSACSAAQAQNPVDPKVFTETLAARRARLGPEGLARMAEEQRRRDAARNVDARRLEGRARAKEAAAIARQLEADRQARERTESKKAQVQRRQAAKPPRQQAPKKTQTRGNSDLAYCQKLSWKRALESPRCCPDRRHQLCGRTDIWALTGEGQWGLYVKGTPKPHTVYRPGN